MLQKLIIVFFIIGFQNTGKCDTLTYWKVYHNGNLIKEMTVFTEGLEIVFKKNDINKGDSITLNYFQDTPCQDCYSYLSVEDGKHHIVTKWKGNGTFTPKVFDLDTLIEEEKEYYEVWYHEGEIDSRLDRRLIFRIKLE